MKQHLNTLYVTREGSYLSLDGETVSVSLHRQRLIRVPLRNLEAIQTFGWDIGASPHLMAHCAEAGVRIAFCNPHGKLLCNVTGFTHGNVLLRRQQYRMADDARASLNVAREMVAAKILNARCVLQRGLRDRTDMTEAERHAAAEAVRDMARGVRRARAAESASALLGVEGNAAECYFGAFGSLLAGEDFRFDRRSRRPPKDPVNALLSFAYALLSSDCKSALEAVGLDSAVGFYHRDRPGRPGLALDLMEEFRAPLADRLALTLLNRRQLSPGDFAVDEGGSVRLTDDARRTVLTTWQERKKEMIVHPFLQERVTLGLLPHIQARLLAQRVRGALDAYPPMFWK
ncbi:MAG: type I-C CRISPR-associated endonuclease Cas1c [Akkermansiaceae bacterium]|nr:type I-C CRISPR-associated endonuclease Cas1c [Akkermansiaceae bacterium]